jgi:hypothetical protein
MAIRYIITVLSLLVCTSAWGANPSVYFDKSYAVVIGIRNYKNAAWPELVNNENDANAMSNFLAGQGFEVKTFIGPQATKQRILSYLEDDLPKLLRGGDDRFVFYFSGHGATKQFSYQKDPSGYIVPYEGLSKDHPSSWISMETLQQLAKKLGNARHQLFILDACFAGNFLTKSIGDLSTVSEKNNPGYLNDITSRIARQCLAAGGADQSTHAVSRLLGYEKFSDYTSFLLEGLREGKADTYPDGVITASELYTYLGPRAASDINTPCGGTFPGHQQGDFVFRSPLPATATRRDIFRDTERKGGYDEDKHDWELLSKLGESGLNTYLNRHSNGIHVNEARSRLNRLRAKELKAQKQVQDQMVYELRNDVRYATDPRVGEELIKTATSRPSTRKTLSKEEQAQALYEWQTNFIYAKNSGAIEEFLRRFPGSKYEQEARRKRAELKAQGR